PPCQGRQATEAPTPVRGRTGSCGLRGERAGFSRRLGSRRWGQASSLRRYEGAGLGWNRRRRWDRECNRLQLQAAPAPERTLSGLTAAVGIEPAAHVGLRRRGLAGAAGAVGIDNAADVGPTGGEGVPELRDESPRRAGVRDLRQSRRLELVNRSKRFSF